MTRRDQIDYSMDCIKQNAQVFRDALMVVSFDQDTGKVLQAQENLNSNLISLLEQLLVEMDTPEPFKGIF